jgi:hypothetical protein
VRDFTLSFQKGGEVISNFGLRISDVGMPGALDVAKILHVKRRFIVDTPVAPEKIYGK